MPQITTSTKTCGNTENQFLCLTIGCDEDIFYPPHKSSIVHCTIPIKSLNIVMGVVSFANTLFQFGITLFTHKMASSALTNNPWINTACFKILDITVHTYSSYDWLLINPLIYPFSFCLFLKLQTDKHL